MHRRDNTPVSTINISTVTLVKVILIAMGIFLVFLLRDVLALLFVSLLFASALSPWVTHMQRRGIPRFLGILLIYFTIISIISLAVVLLIPPLVEQYNQLTLAVPYYVERFSGFVQSLNLEIDIIEQSQKAFEGIQSALFEVVGGIFIKIVDFFSVLVAALLVAVITFYMIVEEETIIKAVHSLTPAKYQSFVNDLIERIQKKIGLWLRGQLILSLIIFCLVFLGLTVLGVKYALILALVAGLTEFVPIIGPILGAVPAVFIAFNEAPFLAVWVILLYLLIQRLENDILVPRVMQQALGLNPLLSIVAILIGAKVAGFMGILFALPVATIICVVIDAFFGEDEAASGEAELEEMKIV